MSVPIRQVLEWNRLEEVVPEIGERCLFTDGEGPMWLGVWDQTPDMDQARPRLENRDGKYYFLSTMLSVTNWAAIPVSRLSDDLSEQIAHHALMLGKYGPAPGSPEICDSVDHRGLEAHAIRVMDGMVVWAHDQGFEFCDIVKSKRLRLGSKKHLIMHDLWKARYS